MVAHFYSSDLSRSLILLGYVSASLLKTKREESNLECLITTVGKITHIINYSYEKVKRQLDYFNNRLSGNSRDTSHLL